MPTYKYSAVNVSGKKVYGILSSASERSARQQIKAGNLTPLSLDLSRNRFYRKPKVNQKDLLFAKNNGFPDAFIVAFKNNEKISLTEAERLSQ